MSERTAIPRAPILEPEATETARVDAVRQPYSSNNSDGRCSIVMSPEMVMLDIAECSRGHQTAIPFLRPPSVCCAVFIITADLAARQTTLLTRLVSRCEPDDS